MNKPNTPHSLLPRSLARIALLLVLLAPCTIRAQAGEVVADLNALLEELPHVQAERRGDALVVTGWPRSAEEAATLAKVLARHEQVLDLTTPDKAANDRMVEVDVIICVVSDTVADSIGFDFLNLINLQYNFFANRHLREGMGYAAPGLIGAIVPEAQWGQLFAAKVNYNVNIANASNQEVKIIARPHLTSLNGETATFQTGGEIVFQVSGIESGDIKPYPYGITLSVTPTILRSPAPDGRERVLLDVDASRTSVLGRLFADTGGTGSGDDDVSFDKTSVQSKALLAMDETLVLSGLYQREYRSRLKGVPYLRRIPGLNLFFSNKVEADDVLSTIIFLTPREPSLVNQELQDATEAFIDRRIEYLKARASGPEAIAGFKKEYPKWFTPAPNYYASHLFLTNNSGVYRSLRGEDLRVEDIRRDILDISSAGEASSARQNKKMREMLDVTD